jgi:RAB6A-GEF complex partner protein 1
MTSDAFLVKTHLFLHHILRFHLRHAQLLEAVVFASHYQHLVYFTHTLEILLHGVLEDEADARVSSPSSPGHEAGENERAASSTTMTGGDVLPRVVEFLDHFPDSLQVVVACARKTEVARWSYLFDVVGKPRDLFEVRTTRDGRHVLGSIFSLIMMGRSAPRNALRRTYSKWRHRIF